MEQLPDEKTDGFIYEKSLKNLNIIKFSGLGHGCLNEKPDWFYRQIKKFCEKSYSKDETLTANQSFISRKNVNFQTQGSDDKSDTDNLISNQRDENKQDLFMEDLNVGEESEGGQRNMPFSASKTKIREDETNNTPLNNSADKTEEKKKLDNSSLKLGKNSKE